MKAKRKGLWIGLCGFFATLALAVGIGIGKPASNQSDNVQAAASTGTPTISMVPGASVRKVEGSPGIKFTARIDNYNADYQYGMLILPQDALINLGWDNDTDYIAALEEFGDDATYANKICSVYTDKATGEKRISFALTNLYDENFSLNLLGIPYTLKDGVYDYADINVVEDARSISYVASMALKYESDLTQENINFLEKYASGNLDIDQDGYFDDITGGGDAIITPAQYEIKYTFNVAGENVALKTSQAYAGGSTVSFKYYIPAGTVTSWWGVAWSTSTSDMDIYKAADSNRVEGNPLSTNLGAWVDVSFNLPAGGPYYLYFGSEVGAAHGRWMLDGENAYVLIKDFKIGNQEHTVGANGKSEMFTMDGVAVTLIKKSNATGSFVAPPVDSMLGFNADAIGGHERIAMITNNAYSGVKEITFKAVWTGNATSSRWGFSYTNNPSTFGYDDGKTLEEQISWINCYSPRFGVMKQDAGVEYTYRLTISGGKWEMYAGDEKIGGGDYIEGQNYFYFMACPTFAGGVAFYIEDFSITYADGTVVDTFNGGKSTIFVESSTKNAVHGSSGMVFEESTFGNGEEVEPEVPEAPEEIGEIAMKYSFNKGDSVSHITKEAYPGGSTISFKYYIPEGTKTQWFRLSYTDGTPDFYDSPFSLLSLSVGAWMNMTYTLPAGGPYKIFFAAESGNWTAGSYMLIDDFTVGDVKENFNCGIDNSIFSITDKNIIGEGEGYVPLTGMFGAKIYGDKISGTKTTPTFITKQAYTFTEPTVVTFDYYMSGNTNSKWWAFFWTNNQKVASIYAHVENNKSNNDGRDLPTNVQNAWATASVEVPAGTWYLYLGMAKGEWSGGHVIIDNFKIGDQVTETFNAGIDVSIFVVSPFSSHHAAVELADGVEDFVFVPGDYSAKLDFSASFDNNAKTFITKQAYPGGSTVSFKYMIPEETTIGDWWAIDWDTNGTSPDFWAVGNGPASPKGGINPNPNKLKGQGWVEYSFTLPNDSNMYYLYFTGYQNWSGYVYIDNFTVNGEVENFDHDPSEWIFSVNNKSYVSLGEGYVKTNDAAKIKIDLISSTASTPSFITSQKYVSDGTLVVSFDYYISGNVNKKWWALSWTSDNKVASLYAFNAPTEVNSGKELPATAQDSWQTASVTIPAGEWYFYIAGAVGEWNGGYVLIDNFKIGNQAFETFDNGVNNYGIFLDNRDSKPDAITTLVGGGTEPTIPEEPEVPEESGITGPNSLAEKLEDGSILEFLASGGYAYLYAKNDSIPTGDNMPASMLRLEGVISYVLDGKKEFAIYFGDAKYLYVSENRVALYNGTELLVEREISVVEGVLRMALSAGNVLTASVNGCDALVAALDTFSGIKLVALGGDGGVVFNSLNFTTYERKDVPLNEEAPVYLSAEKIDITAYAFDSESMISDEGFQLLADAGFTKTMALLQGRIDGLAYDNPSQAEVERLMAEVNADALAALELAERYGLKHYVFNEGIYNLERHSAWNEYMDEIADASSYTLSSAFAGHFFADEPYIGYKSSGSVLKKYNYDPTVESDDGSSLAKLLESYRAYRAAFPDSEVYINLNPRYDTDGGEYRTTNLQIYKDYVDYYVENIAKDKDGVKGTGFVSVDIYPLKTSGLNEMHLWNLEYIAKKCRDNNLEMRIYIQATESGNAAYKVAATKTVNDFMLQIYSALAYGAKEIVYYQFTDHSEYNTGDTENDQRAKDNYQDALVNGQDLTCYNAYYLAKEVNGHVGALSNAYMNFTWKSASVFGSKTSITQFNKLESKASAYGYLSSVSSSESVLVGNFDDADGKYTYNAQYGYMVVNYGNTSNSQAESSIIMTFNGTPKKALVYENGVAKVYTLNSNQLTLNLELGEGAFVIPFSL